MIDINNDNEYDYSEDFTSEEMNFEEPEDRYETFEDKLREIGMSIHDFI